ncbi:MULTISPECIES: hypothetical protein [unclassified Clostridium]|uniref:hypothetical protein n=1 Tax=unclassified Clostridium TaxID=2614128 RepID=UPI0002979BCF|nr:MULTISPECIES: hypothetical protein [unclassified Clostridium]EKQ57951.1 MAG: hypothetical protein A370_00379 [Clostridium sp. Maddingley MBC34-26]
MFSKKILSVLLAIGVVVSAFALFYKLIIRGDFTESINQNIVYTKNDTSADSLEFDIINGPEYEAYRERSAEALKKYFNVSTENVWFNAQRYNEKTLDKAKSESLKQLQNLYENGKISKEEYNKQVKMHDGGSNDLWEYFKNVVVKVRHGMVFTSWESDDRHYYVDFNENTKEVDSVRVFGKIYNKSDVPLTLSEEQIKNTAEDFIKQNKLGDIENPKCILVKEEHVTLKDGTDETNGWYAFYQDGNDQNKKVMVGINEYTGKVDSFAVKAYADFEYNKYVG